MIDEILRSSRIQPLEPQQGDADLAWEEVCRRRRTRTLRTQVVAAAGLVVVVMVGLLPSLQDVDNPAQLNVAGQSSGRRVEVASPGGQKEVTREDLASGATESAERPSGSRASGPSSPAAAADQPPAAGQPQTPSAARTKPPANRTRYETVSVGCLDWCLQGRATRAYDGYELSMDLCVAVGGRTRRFSFATAQELDLSVSSQNGPAEWTWSVGQRFAANEHHVDIAAGECAKWTVIWDATDESGSALPAGRYTLNVRSLAEQAAGASSASSFDIPE